MSSRGRLRQGRTRIERWMDKRKKCPVSSSFQHTALDVISPELMFGDGKVDVSSTPESMKHG